MGEVLGGVIEEIFLLLLAAKAGFPWLKELEDVVVFGGAGHSGTLAGPQAGVLGAKDVLITGESLLAEGAGAGVGAAPLLKLGELVGGG